MEIFLNWKYFYFLTTKAIFSGLARWRDFCRALKLVLAKLPWSEVLSSPRHTPSTIKLAAGLSYFHCKATRRTWSFPPFVDHGHVRLRISQPQARYQSNFSPWVLIFPLTLNLLSEPWNKEVSNRQFTIWGTLSTLSEYDEKGHEDKDWFSQIKHSLRLR